VSFNTCGASFDSVLAAYTGRSLRSLKLVNYNNNGCGVAGGTGSRLAFTAGRGQTYWIAVAGFAPRGVFRLRAARLAAPRNDNFAEAVPIRLGQTIVGTTRDATRELGEPAHGAEGVNTVWFRVTVATAQVVKFEACSGDDPPRVAVYTGSRVNRLVRVVAADQCVAQFSAQPGTYRVALVATGRGHSFSLRARAATPPANDNFANATEIAIGSTIPATTRDATREPREPVVLNDYPFTVWFRLTLPAGASVEIVACPPGESQIAVFNGTQLEALRSFGAFSCGIRVTTMAAATIYIQVQSLREGDFNVSVQTLAAAL